MRSIVLTLLLVSGVLTGEEPPEPIRSYYDRAAFLASYSTQQERTNNIALRKQGPRAKKIAEAQTLNAQMVLRTDPGMPLGSKAMPPSQGYVALPEIVECSVTADTVILKLRSHQLESTAVARFCALYDQVGGAPEKLPTLEQRLAMASGKVAPIIVHRWVMTPDGWRKQEADGLLLGR